MAFFGGKMGGYAYDKVLGRNDHFSSIINY